MQYREHPPPPPLADQVACLWTLDHTPAPGAPPEKIVPDGRAELIFNLAAPYRRVESGVVAQGPQPTSFVVGQLRTYMEVVPTGRVSILGVRLEPTAMHRLVRGPMSELTGRTVAVEDLGVPALVELEERLHEAGGTAERLALVGTVLTDLLGGSIGGMKPAVDLIRHTHGGLDLGQVARVAGVSVRTLDRRFPVEVGLSPKLYSRQARLQRVLGLLRGDGRPRWAELALVSGCFDQAHLSREFRAFTGEPPGAFVRGRHELSDHLTGMV